MFVSKNLYAEIDEEEEEQRRKRRRRRRKRKEEKMALFMKSIINFQQMIRCKEVLLRKDWYFVH